MKLLGNHPSLRPLLIFLLYALLAVVMTLPLAFHLDSRLLGTDSNALNDTYFSVWIFGWQAHQLIADPLNLFQGNIFYPFANTLAFSEIILPGALMYLPLAYASGNPVLAYNLVLLVSFPLNALAMYLWASDWLAQRGTKGEAAERQRTPDSAQQTTADRHAGTATDSRSTLNLRSSEPITAHLAAFLAGIIFAFCTYKLGELRHVQLLLALFMPLTLLYLGRFMRRPNAHNAVLVALFFALNALSSLYYAVFLAFAVALYLGLDLFARRLRYQRAHFLYGALALGMVVVLVTPFVLPFFQLERQYNFSEGRDPRLFSARPYSYIATPTTQVLYGSLTRNFYAASKGQPLFPGLAALALGLVGLIALLRAHNRTWLFLLLLGSLGFVLSFGPLLILGRTSEPAMPFHLPYYWVSLVVTPLKSLNAPARFVVLSMLALAMLAAYGSYALMLKFPRYAWALAIGIAALLVLEYIPAPLRLARADTGANVSPAYHFLRAQPPGQPVVEVPMGQPNFADQDRYVVYAYNSLVHGQPLVNGYSTFIPPDYYALVRAVQSFPSASAARRLQRWGARWVVVHADRYKDKAVLGQTLAGLTNLEHVQDFGNLWLYQIKQQ